MMIMIMIMTMIVIITIITIMMMIIIMIKMITFVTALSTRPGSLLSKRSVTPWRFCCNHDGGDGNDYDYDHGDFLQKKTFDSLCYEDYCGD